MARILVVDDEAGIRSFLAEALADEGHEVEQAGDGEAAAALLELRAFHLMITDLKMPRMGGMELLALARRQVPEMGVVVLTAHGSVDTAVAAMKAGAYDFLQKPVASPDELRLCVRRALEHRRLRDAREEGRTAAGEILVASDPAMVAVVGQLDRVAPTEATVLICGESGSGKEVAARRVHQRSGRVDGPFVAVNCAALSAQLLESELFGHEKGAFTGAVEQRRGRFELADGGTLFLDEVAEIKPELQAKLLRVLEERKFERVGGQRTLEVDIRLLAATNRDLQEEMAAGRFREDLYHRLAVFPVTLPPLRQRPGDILPLAQHLLGRIAARLKRSDLHLSDGAAARLLTHDWPGNVRELANVLERAAILSAEGAIGAEALLVVPGRPVAAAAFDGTLKEMEKKAIASALAAAGGHRKNAAARLGLGLRTLYAKIKEYGLD